MWSPGWPGTHPDDQLDGTDRSPCLYFLGAGLKDVCHHAQPGMSSLTWSSSCRLCNRGFSILAQQRLLFIHLPLPSFSPLVAVETFTLALEMMKCSFKRKKQATKHLIHQPHVPLALHILLDNSLSFFCVASHFLLLVFMPSITSLPTPSLRVTWRSQEWSIEVLKQVTGQAHHLKGHLECHSLRGIQGQVFDY